MYVFFFFTMATCTIWNKVQIQSHTTYYEKKSRPQNFYCNAFYCRNFAGHYSINQTLDLMTCCFYGQSENKLKVFSGIKKPVLIGK